MTSLSPTTTAREDFIGKTNATVTVSLSGPANAGAEIVHLRYAGEPVDLEDPFQFKIQPGANFLVVLVEASKPGILCRLVENCGTTSQVLDRFHYDPMNPARGYIIRGLR